MRVVPGWAQTKPRKTPPPGILDYAPGHRKDAVWWRGWPHANSALLKEVEICLKTISVLHCISLEGLLWVQKLTVYIDSSNNNNINQNCFPTYCCRNQYSRNQAPHSESWRTQVYYTGGPRGVNTPSSEPRTKGLQSFYTQTGMIKLVCKGWAVAKSRTRVSEISSSS